VINTGAVDVYIKKVVFSWRDDPESANCTLEELTSKEGVKEALPPGLNRMFESMVFTPDYIASSKLLCSKHVRIEVVSPIGIIQDFRVAGFVFTTQTFTVSSFATAHDPLGRVFPNVRTMVNGTHLCPV